MLLRVLYCTLVVLALLGNSEAGWIGFETAHAIEVVELFMFSQVREVARVHRLIRVVLRRGQRRYIEISLVLVQVLHLLRAFRGFHVHSSLVFDWLLA